MGKKDYNDASLQEHHKLIISCDHKYPTAQVQLQTGNLRRSIRSSHSEVFLGRGVLKICSKFTGEHPSRSEISIAAEQLYWNHTSAWEFSCKDAAYFENTFSNEKLWVVASDQWNWHKVKGVLWRQGAYFCWQEQHKWILPQQ